MPKNIIKELDNTSAGQEVEVSNTVFVPIETIEDIAPTLCTTEAELKTAFEAKLDENGSLEYSPLLGYNLCKHLIKNGLNVLVQGVTGLGSEATSTVDWEALKDKNLYDIRFLTTGALKVDVSQAMIDCAEDRGDCAALVSFDESSSEYIYDISSIKSEVEDITKGQYAAAFTPAFYTEDEDFTKDEEVLIPAACGYLFAYARSIKSNPEWFATAGFDRGVIPELSRVKYKYSTAEVNALQNRTNDSNDNIGIAINAIAYIRPAGFIVYGNRTLKNNATSILTPTSFLNVRNMISIVKKTAYEAGNRFTFEQNSDILFINYKSYITPTLDRITSGDGALGYTINRIKTAERAKLKVEILIQPIEAVEDIELSVIMAADATTVVNE